MPANVNPIWSRLPDVQWGSADGNGGAAGPLKTANTAMDGTGTVLTVFTADATNGGWCDRLKIKPAGTNVATLVRIFLNNGSTNATIANNIFFDEIAIPASTLSQTAAMLPFEFPMNIGMPAGYKVNIVLATTVAAGIFASAIGGKY